MKNITYAIWNKKHKNVLKHWNLKTDEGEYIFSTKEANKLYPWSVFFEEYIKYSREEYIKRGKKDAECFNIWEFAIVKN